MGSGTRLALRLVEGSHHPDKLFANLQLLKYITHPNLVQYIDGVRGSASRLGVVYEYYELNLAEFLQDSYPSGLPQQHVWGCAAQLLSALSTIHEQGLVHHRLSSSSVMVAHNGSDAVNPSNSSDAPTLKLSDWGLHYLTAGGTLAPCPAGDPYYISPEYIVAGPGRATMGNAGAQHTQTVSIAAGECADIWALGILLVEVIIGSLPAPFRGSESTAAVLQGVLDIARARAQAHDRVPGRAKSQFIADSNESPVQASFWPGTVSPQFRKIEEPLRQLVDQCLEPRRVHRLDAKSILRAHSQLARHLSAFNISKGQTDDDYAGLRPILTVPSPPAVPIQGTATMQTAAEVPATVSAAVTRSASLRQLCELFFEWVAHHGGDTGAVDALIDNAIDTKHTGENRGAKCATLRSSRAVPTVGLCLHRHAFPMITLRDRLYSVAVPITSRDGVADFGRSPHRVSGNSDRARTHCCALLLPFVTKGEDDHAESPATDDTDQQPSTREAASGSNSVQVTSIPELCTNASMEPHKLKVISSHHPLWDGCLPQERQQLRVAVIADANLPVPLRERHRAYQEARVGQFRALLERIPGSRNEIIRESKTDIPPALRAEVWPILLGLSAESLDAETMLAPMHVDSPGNIGAVDEKTRKQIDVDLPRCHQENAILASAEGQTCLRFVLEAWLETHAQSNVYCQGLDSLAAPFVTLFFHRCCTSTGTSEPGQDQVFSLTDEWDPYIDERADPQYLSHKEDVPRMRLAVQPAYCCLVAFTGRLLDQIFASGSTSMLRAQLAEFSELLSVELTELAAHFRAEGVTVDLFAIPWLLTLFAHVLPLPNVLQLWDVFLANWDEDHAESLPLYVAVAVLRQSEAQLLALDFNGILVHLSRLPPIDLDCAIRDAVAKWAAGTVDKR